MNFVYFSTQQVITNRQKHVSSHNLKMHTYICQMMAAVPKKTILSNCANISRHEETQHLKHLFQFVSNCGEQRGSWSFPVCSLRTVVIILWLSYGRHWYYGSRESVEFTWRNCRFLSELSEIASFASLQHAYILVCISKNWTVKFLREKSMGCMAGVKFVNGNDDCNDQAIRKVSVV